MEEASRVIAYPTVEQICDINRRMIDEFGGLFLPPDNILNKGALQYILVIISKSIYGQMPYVTLKEKASAIAYHIITGHVFYDGNKRTGLHTAWEFLHTNGIKVSLDASIIDLTLGVASGQNSYDDLLQWFHAHQND